MAKLTSFAFATLVQLIAVALIVLCVYAPAYHRQRVTLPGGTSIELALSLTHATATGQCFTAWSNKFMRKRWPICERLTLAMNGKSLRELSAFLCGADFMMFHLPDTGCSDVEAIQNASFIYLIFLAFCLGSLLLSILLTICYFTASPFLITRSAAVGAQVFVAVMHLLGFVVYLAFSGELHPAMFLGRVLLFSPDLHRNTSSYAAGIGVSLMSVIWALLLPLWAHFHLKKRYSRERGAELQKLMLDQEEPLYTDT